MLLSVKPLNVATLVPPAAKQAANKDCRDDDDDEDNKIFMGDLTGDIREFLPARRDFYVVKRAKKNCLEATLCAIKDAFEYGVHGARSKELCLALPYVLHEVHRGEERAELNVAFLDDNGKPTHSVCFSASKASESTRFVFHHANSLTAYQLLSHGACIPALGQLKIEARSGDLRTSFTAYPHYDLHEVFQLEEFIRDTAAVKRVVYKVPCYAQGAEADIARCGLPATEVRLYIEVQSAATRSGGGRVTECKLAGMSVVCAMRADPHQLIYTKRAVFEDHRSFNAERARQMTALNERVLRVRSSVATSAGVSSNPAEALTEKLRATLGDGVEFSWSASHLNHVVYSHQGQQQMRVGHVGELLVAIAASRSAAALYPRYPVEVALRMPDSTARLLQKVGADQLLSALAHLYQPKYGRLPTVHELLTHTSGLPYAGSVDACVDLELLEQILPSRNPSTRPATQQLLLAHVLMNRTTLIAPPGAVVHHSALGYAVLGHCVNNLPQTLRNLCSEFGMDATYLEQDECVAPFEHMHSVSARVVSSTNDLARLVACIEKSNQDPCAFPLLAHTTTQCYLISQDHKDGMHAVCEGGLEACVVRVHLAEYCRSAAKSHKVALNVMYKVGDHGTAGSTVMLWVPALHLGFALHANMSARALFSKTHKEACYGKQHGKKLFRIKHLIKAAVRELCAKIVGERGADVFDLDTLADVDHAVTAELPINYAAYAAACSCASDVPPLDGVDKKRVKMHELLEDAPMFQGDGTPFYPLFEAVHRFQKEVQEHGGSTATAAIKLDERRMIESLPSFRVFKRQSAFYMRESRAPAIQLAYDPAYETCVGVSLATAVKMDRGCMRLVSEHRGGDLGEHLSMHVLPDKMIGFHYRGCLYVSKAALLEVKAAVEALHNEQAELRVRSARAQTDKKFRPWSAGVSIDIRASLTEGAARQQAPIAAGVGLALGAGALGLGVGALAGAALARPYYSYPYGYYAPPPPPYYGPPPPYWRRYYY